MLDQPRHNLHKDPLLIPIPSTLLLHRLTIALLPCSRETHLSAASHRCHILSYLIITRSEGQGPLNRNTLMKQVQRFATRFCLTLLTALTTWYRQAKIEAGLCNEVAKVCRNTALKYSCPLEDKDNIGDCGSGEKKWINPHHSFLGRKGSWRYSKAS